jgi:predicted metal-dependent hydrolase
MQKYLTIKDQTINYTLKKSKRAKLLRISIHPGGEVKISAPYRFSERIIEAIVKTKADWLFSKIDFLKQVKVQPKPSRKDYLRYKVELEKIVQQRLEFFNRHYNLQYQRITIRDQKTRWGSCSSKGNLNFNYKILFLSPEVRDYIIVHELCHLKEMNHSRRFWNLVAETIPNYVELRKELKGVKGYSLT